VLLLGLLALLAVGNLWATFHRSGIPVGLAGRVERIEVRREKHPGLDDVHLVTVAGQVIHLDAEVAALLQVGDEVRKSGWSASLTTPSGTFRLTPSRDFWRMLRAMPLLFGGALLLLRGRQ
jgi:hypothetical protein